jgi:outer membrane murein-binding lipoprotein Lpp
MLTGNNLVAVAIASTLMILTGCATTGGSLASSAERLERNADSLTRDARFDPGSDYGREARDLAEQAHDFRLALSDRTADNRDVRAEFEELSRDYHALRDEIDRSDDRETQLGFRAVTEAYLDVERGMTSDTDRSRYARERDPRYDRRY